MVWQFPIVFFLGLLLIWSGADILRPELSDPDYLVRRDHLRDRLKEHPHARLTVVLGSSRTAFGFLPESLPQSTNPSTPPTIWFNMAHYGAGPAFNRVILDRLLRDGIRPDVAVIELMPPFVARENPRFVGPHLSSRELLLASTYLPTRRTAWHLVRHRFVKVANLRQVFDPYSASTNPGPLGGPLRLEETITAEDRTQRLAGQHLLHGPAARAMTVDPSADRAIRDTLQHCREWGITPVLLLAPEGSSFRSWYDPGGLRRFETYLINLAREYRVPLVDARAWLTEEDFLDGHHQLRRGAIQFTSRLVREVTAQQQ